MVEGFVEWTANQFRTSCQTWPKMPQCKKRCEVDSINPQPVTQSWASSGIILLQNKLSFVGNLSRKSRQEKTETLRGISFLQSRDAETAWTIEEFAVPPISEWYADLTVYPATELGVPD